MFENDNPYEMSMTDAELTVRDVRVIIQLIDNQSNAFMNAGMGGLEKSGFEGMTVVEFYAWCDGMLNMLGTP